MCVYFSLDVVAGRHRVVSEKNWVEKFNFFIRNLILKSETLIFSRFITHKVKHFGFNLGDHGVWLMRIKHPVSQNIA